MAGKAKLVVTEGFGFSLRLAGLTLVYASGRSGTFLIFPSPSFNDARVSPLFS